MKDMAVKKTRWLARATAVALVAGLVASGSSAQDLLPPPSPSQPVQENVPGEPVQAPAQKEELLPGLPVRKLNLQECIALAFESQPALVAARASLAAAESAQRGLNSIMLGRLLSPDLVYRKQQACLGVQIAQAGLFQAEWETRYAVTRNYYSVIYARQQTGVVNGLVDKLDRAVQKAELLLKAGDPNLKINTLDRDNLIVNRDLYKARGFEASIGVDKATAALREAIGVKQGYPLEIAEDSLPPLVENLNKEELVALALSQRGELQQAYAASRVTALEICAQGKIRTPVGRTFAMGSDIHAKPIPQGTSNGQYTPSAIGLEMPVSMAGHRSERMQRARDLNERAGAVVDKTENLIVLETEAAYYKWLEAKGKVTTLAALPALAKKIGDNTQNRFDNGNVSGEELIRARTLEDQARANYNEALYNHVLALAALERITAGGYQFPHKQP